MKSIKTLLNFANKFERTGCGSAIRASSIAFALALFFAVEKINLSIMKTKKIQILKEVVRDFMVV